MALTDRADDGLAAVESDAVTDPSNYQEFVAVFARSYKHDSDPAAVVDLYQDFQEYTATHPNAGSQKIASALGVKRSHIRRWTDGAVPYVVQGLQTAETEGWIPMEFESRMFSSMNKLVAWVFSSGSIHGERWTPVYVVDTDQQRARLTQLLDSVGCDVTEADTASEKVSGTSLSPTPNGAILGRVLHALGAPAGLEKRSLHLTLPAYLDSAPPFIRQAFLKTYLRNRQRNRDRDKPWLSFGEDRADGYQRELVAFIEDVTGESASISGMDIHVSADAVRALGLV